MDMQHGGEQTTSNATCDVEPTSTLTIESSHRLANPGENVTFTCRSSYDNDVLVGDDDDATFKNKNGFLSVYNAKDVTADGDDDDQAFSLNDGPDNDDANGDDDDNDNGRGGIEWLKVLDGNYYNFDADVSNNNNNNNNDYNYKTRNNNSMKHKSFKYSNNNNDDVNNNLHYNKVNKPNLNTQHISSNDVTTEPFLTGNRYQAETVHLTYAVISILNIYDVRAEDTGLLGCLHRSDRTKKTFASLMVTKPPSRIEITTNAESNDIIQSGDVIYITCRIHDVIPVPSAAIIRIGNVHLRPSAKNITSLIFCGGGKSFSGGSCVRGVSYDVRLEVVGYTLGYLDDGQILQCLIEDKVSTASALTTIATTTTTSTTTTIRSSQ
ncbi:hypothetical protein HELRODRAFT_194023 [Helobdella robusta]|uniref:Immunoglobulin domain-containing protein n=1 Tax=Helobdella robusta TaxID=6412 RepID=T1FVK8_HELRO|nr:hypothetical protein HELRODRAFT_194023 [Helobdella robusta]ESN93681.1 hypothetical protein HELRODRAFT_194023 [Helobdella robusta]